MEEKEVKSLKNQRNLFLALTIILALLCGGTLWKLMNTVSRVETLVVENKVASETNEGLDLRLELLTQSYDSLGEEYQGLDSMFTAEKELVEQIKAELKTSKGNSASLKRKVASLEKRLKEYFSQIEELKAKNEELTSQNIVIKTALDSTVTENSNLSRDKEELSSKVQAGSVLKAYDISAVAVKMRNNGQEMPTTKIKKVEKIKICFVLSENAIAQSGAKTVYLRLSDPDGVVIAEGTDDNYAFEYDGKKIIYTAKEQITYNNKAMDICMAWNKPREYKAGVYYADLFVDGVNIGTNSFTLEK